MSGPEASGYSLRAARPLALTMGDPAGIGLEIALKAWHARKKQNVPPFVLYADADALEQRAASLGLATPIEQISGGRDEACKLFQSALPVVDIPVATSVTAGKPDTRNAAATIAAIRSSISDVKAGTVRAVITNPIAKSVLYETGFSHPGHTEFLAELAAEHWPSTHYHPVMMLACAELRVVPLTIHIPLADVPRRMSRELICNTIRITAEALSRDFGITAPRIAVAGLNPHAGEGGAIGAEDRDVIFPALASLAAVGYNVTGPLPADTMFHPAARAKYDVAVCMYHDQALIPIKTLAFDEGVNVTLGLPFIRTSPDHGTAFDIATLGIASETSLVEALKLANVMAARRESVAS
jgi:4-hydroxythreonine-4-phosphate dehydrogenase